MLGIRFLSIFMACCCAFVLADCPPLFAAAVTSPSSRTVGNPANAVTLKGYVEKAGQTVTIQAVDQNTGELVTLGTTKAAMSGTAHTTPSGTHYTAYPWSFPASVLALKYWAPQKIVADLATSQGHLELFATASGQNLDTFSAAASASAQASGQDPQTAAANFSDGKSSVLFDPNGVGSGPEGPWVTVAGMISDSHSPYYSPVAWSIGSYTVENGTKIYALVCSPTEGGPYPVVVFNHGGTGSGDGGNLNGVVTAQGWTVLPVLLGANGQPVIGPDGLPTPIPDSLGQCLDWAKRGWVFATSAYRGEGVTITSASSQFSPPATPWMSDGKVEFCMGEVTDVMALTDLLVNHTGSILLGNTSEKVKINVNGQVLMYGYSHGGCITHRAVEQGAPVNAFSVIEGFTDFPLNYLNWTSNGQTQQNAAIAAGAWQPGVATSVYLPDAAHVMGYNWRSAHYFASRGDLSIQKFKTMPILILQGDIDTANPVFLDEPAEIAADIGATSIFVGPNGLAPPSGEPCIAGPVGATIPASMTAPNKTCPIAFTPQDTGDSCVTGSVPVIMSLCKVVQIPLAPQQLHYLVVYHNMNHTNGGLAF
ncbi:MAG: hypothetical protein WBF64_09980, partial [Xanthobacteraceae bacterium]